MYCNYLVIDVFLAKVDQLFFLFCPSRQADLTVGETDIYFKLIFSPKIHIRIYLHYNLDVSDLSLGKPILTGYSFLPFVQK